MASATQRTKRRGRPQLPPEQRKRHNITMRLRDQLKADLQAQADHNGRSLSEESEMRLEASLLAESAVENAFGGALSYWVMASLASAAAAYSERIGADWLDDPDSFDETIAVWHLILGVLGPEVLVRSGVGAGSRRTLPERLRNHAPEVVADALEKLAADIRGRFDDAMESTLREAYRSAQRRGGARKRGG